MTELNSINLGPKRSFTVAECVLWAALCGPQFAAQVAAVVSLEEVPKSHGKIFALAKDVAAISYGHSTATSITKYLRSPVLGNRPKLVRKNTKAAAAEAATEAAKAEAAVRMEETKRLAAEYEAMDGGALTETEALAQAAEPGDPLREQWLAYQLLLESDRRAALLGEMLSARAAAAAETAAIDAAVAAAAAAEAAAASKAAAAVRKAAAEAVAAENKRRALDARNAGHKDGEDFSWRPVFGVGARVRVLAATAPGLLPRLATGCGVTIVMAFDTRTRECTGSGAGCWVILGSAMESRCAC